MTGHPSTDIIEAIDGALDDLQVSVDAMRWKPPKSQRQLTLVEQAMLPALRPPGVARLMYVRDARQQDLAMRMRLGVHRVPEPLFTNDEVRVLADEFHRATGMRLGAVLQALAAESSPDGPSPADPVDVMASALQARQQRNTGPAKPAPWARHHGHR